MKTVVVLFGGKSVEHDISIITGNQVMKNLSPVYNVIPIYISKKGKWFTGEKLKDVIVYQNFNEKNYNECFFKPPYKKLFIKKRFKNKSFDIETAVICLHGMNGEDGTVQGVMQLCNIPYSSCDNASSGLCMDKVLCKTLLKGAKIPTPDFEYCQYNDFINNSSQFIQKVKKRLGFPAMVKPARLGSSVGISKCKNEEDLEKAINFAGHFDNKIIVEKMIEDFDEINIACIGDNSNVECSSLERVKNNGEFLNFEDKYLSGDIKREVGCSIDEKIKEKIESYAKQAYYLCDCFGVLRMDFFVDKLGKVWLNEINTIPGSMSYYLWKKNGYTFGSMLNKIIKMANKRQENMDKLNYVFDTKAVVEFGKINNCKMNK